MIAILFGAALLIHLPMDGLSAAPLGIAERAADGFAWVDMSTVTQVALAN